MQYKVPGVYIKELPAGSRPIPGVGTAMPAFIGFTETQPDDNRGQPVFISSLMEYEKKFGGLVDTFYLPYAVHGYFMNGGRSCYVQSLSTLEDLAGVIEEMVSIGTLPTVAKGKSFELRSKIKGQLADQIQILIEDVTIEEQAASSSEPKNEGEVTSDAAAPAASGKPSADEFKMIISAPGKKPEPFDRLTAKSVRGTRTFVDEVNSKSHLIEIVPHDGTLARPQNGIYTLAIPPARPSVSQEDIKGNVSKRTGLGAWEEVADVTMMVFPDLMTLYERSPKGNDDLKMVGAIQNELLTHCCKMQDRFAILDAPPGLDIEGIRRYRNEIAQFNETTGKYGALYYPWVQVVNPAQKRNGNGPANGANSRFKMLPPSGHLAGVYARVDTDRGVHKAPANEAILGAIALERRVIDSEQEVLNPIGINCIREFSGRGILVWGARTLAEPSSEWRYINVRRLFNFIEESIYEGTQWVVFEPNDMDLWERVKRTITAFLTRVWRSGALFGTTPEEAFYVKCDKDNNPPEELDAGILNVEIGLAPVKPAEFVVFSFRQIPGGGGGVSE